MCASCSEYISGNKNLLLVFYGSGSPKYKDVICLVNQTEIFACLCLLMIAVSFILKDFDADRSYTTFKRNKAGNFLELLSPHFPLSLLHSLPLLFPFHSSPHSPPLFTPLLPLPLPFLFLPFPSLQVHPGRVQRTIYGDRPHTTQVYSDLLRPPSMLRWHGMNMIIFLF